MALVKLFIFICVCSAYYCVFTAVLVTAEEVCLWETFNANCSTGQVVFIEMAFYGRMKDNRCFNRTEDETVCSVDVLLHIQKQYGSKQHMRLNLNSELFTKIKTGCYGEPYLDIAHRCTSLIEKEICAWEAFEAQCRPDTDIFIQSALYGRMHSSRCIEYEKPDLNCYANVQLYLESKCNGRNRCRVKASDPKLVSAASTCPPNKEPYLEVEYTCGHGFSCPQFNPSDDANLARTSEGYKVTCPNDAIVKDLLCRGGSWNRDPEKICSTKGDPVLSMIMTIGVPCAAVSVFLSVIGIVAVFIWKCRQRNQRRRSCYIDADEIRSVESTGSRQNPPGVLSQPTLRDVPTTKPQHESVISPTHKNRRLLAEPHDYMELLPQD